MKLSKEYREEARAALKGNWDVAVLATIVVCVIAAVCSSGECAYSLFRSIFGGSASAIITIFVMIPLTIGAHNAFKRLYTLQEREVTKNLFTQGFTNYLHNLWGMLLMYIYIFLWSLLLIVPGIVKTFSYAMTPYILVDNPELSANEAIEMSMKMMQGRKIDLFLLYLSFIGWAILCTITLGIGYLWLAPYIEVSVAAFYKDVRADYEAKMMINENV